MPSVSTPAFYPERLVAAVKARGLTWNVLADLADVRASTLSDYKTGKAIPSIPQLSKIADALGFPVGFFMKPFLSEAELVGPRLFRSNAAMTKRAADQAEAYLGLASECISYAEKWLELPWPHFLEGYRNIEEPFNLEKNQIEAIALAVREKLGYADAPVVRLITKLERNGIPVIRYESMENSKVKIEGLSQHSNIGRPLCAIFSRGKPCLPRENFSLAHELGHIVLHSSIPSQRIDNPKDEKKLEDQANLFASAFLLPRESFLNDMFAPTLKAFEFLKRKWRVSISAMIRRCYDLEVIDHKKYSYLNIQLSRNRMKTREPLDDFFEVDKPMFLRRVFEILVDREGLDIDMIVRELSLSTRDLSDLSLLPASFFYSDDDDLVIFPKF